MNQSGAYSSPRLGYVSQNDELHLPGLSQQPQSASREYQPSAGSATHHYKHDPAASGPSSFASQSSIPNVLQPGGMAARSFQISGIPSASHSTVQTDFQTPPKLSTSGISHGYSRSSPASAYDVQSGYLPYTPSTPSGGVVTSPYGPLSDPKYPSSLGTHRVSIAPLGLADIRPRADSTLSDGLPGSLAYELANSQPGTSNYLGPWSAYAFDWCKWSPQANSAGKLAICSYLEDGHNYINVLDSQIIPSPPDISLPGLSKYSLEFTKIAEATHSYPVTRLLWEPQSSHKQSTDLLATSGDHLRLWSLPSDVSPSQNNTITRPLRDARPVTKLTSLALLSNSKTPDHTAPLTSLDWNAVSPSLIITSSIDTTCTIWDIPSLTAKTQLIAHDKEVYDVRFCANSVDVFVSCGQDGSVRMFDLRSLEHSTIIYEPSGKDERDSSGNRMSPTLAQQTISTAPPLLRLATSPFESHLLATFAQDSKVIRILDVRQPGQALLELRGHGGSVNCIEWSLQRRGSLASGGDDCQVLIWDLLAPSSPASKSLADGPGQPESYRNPVAGWQCDYEIGNLGWVPRLPNPECGEWLGVSAGRGIWGVRLA